MNENVAWATCFYVEPIGNKVFFIYDATSGSGMSITNNMEMVLCTLAKHYHIWEDQLATEYTVYSVEEKAVYKVEHEFCTNPKWTYIGPDDKALRVLYGEK